MPEANTVTQVTAANLAADAAEEITDAVWDQLTSGHTTVGSFGQRVLRKHVEDPRLWGSSPGTDFWMICAPSVALLQATGTPFQGLPDYGWVCTALAHVAAVGGADFFSAADPGAPAHILLADASDLLSSPVIFGDYAHMQQAAHILGYTPTSLNAEVFAAFTTASGDEPSSAFGFVQDAGSVITAAAAGQLACISSNATTFEINSSGASDAGAAVDNAWHVWKIKLTAATAEWFIDGATQGTIALLADEFPVSFEAGIVAAGTNDIAIASIHVWYE